MTELAFHFNVALKVDYACRLARKALRSGASLVVTAEAPTLTELDSALWTFSAVDFIAHEYPHAMAAAGSTAPVVLLERAADAARHEVLLNLGRVVPDGFERFARVIEVVGLDDQERRDARARWKHYAGRGYRIEQFDLAPQGAH